ncbi:hypothetical protein Taro_020004, partial [Colocasia esculenta]|nr:hypothetical protein [Colocasia esculenta]
MLATSSRVRLFPQVLCLTLRHFSGLLSVAVCSVGFCWQQMWVADWLVPTTRSVGGRSRALFGWCFLLFGLVLALLSTCGVLVLVGRPTCGWSEPLVFGCVLHPCVWSPLCEPLVFWLRVPARIWRCGCCNEEVVLRLSGLIAL